jgi:cysteinyl-tRNA synthetase
MMRFLPLAIVLLLVAAPASALDKPRDWVPPPPESVPNHREQWRSVVIELANYAKGRRKDFIMLARGGVELAVKGEREVLWEELRDPYGRTFEKRLPLGSVYRPYLKVLDGIVLDGLYCGPNAFAKPLAEEIKARVELDRTIAEEKARGIHRLPVPQPLGPFSLDPKEELRKAAEVKRNAERLERQRRVVYAVDAVRNAGRRVLSIEDCKTVKEADAAAKASDRDRVLSYAASGNSKLDSVPRGSPRAENAAPVTTITAARNWLPMTKVDKYGSKAEWLMALEKTNHDVLAIDPTYRGAEAVTQDEIKRLKFKELGAPRLVLAVLPVGIAQDGRWYWQKGWEAGNPPFLFAPVAEEPGTFITDVGDMQWKKAIGQMVTWLQDLGFDGIMLDDLDTYLWFEDLMSVEG